MLILITQWLLVIVEALALLWEIHSTGLIHAKNNEVGVG